MTKYRNKKTVVDGYIFDSKLEAKRFNELKFMLKLGTIFDLTLQKKFTLQDGFRYNGKAERAITYVCDFYYKDKQGVEYVEDAKGFKTDVYAIKRKLFLFKYSHIVFKEIIW